jgi:hypothetical protein
MIQKAMTTISTTPDEPTREDVVALAFGLSPEIPPARSLRMPNQDQGNLFADMHQATVKVISRHMRAAWMNPSQRRRALAKTLPSWMQLQTSLHQLTNYLLDHQVRVFISLFPSIPLMNFRSLIYRMKRSLQYLSLPNTLFSWGLENLYCLALPWNYTAHTNAQLRIASQASS